MKKQTSTSTETGIKSKTIIDFTGKTIYVGIDIHKKDWQVALYYEGMILCNHRMKAGSQGLLDFLKKRYAGATYPCVYESSAWGFTLQRFLKRAGIACIVAHAGDVPGSNKEKLNKTDAVDAVRLARHYAAGLLKGIHVPDETLQKQRNLIRFRKKLRGDLTRTKNRLKSVLKYQGIEVPARFDNAHWSYAFLTWIEQQAQQDDHLKDTLLLMLRQVKELRGLLLEAERKLRELMNQEPFKERAAVLMKVPGIGRITAMLWILEIGEVTRFERFDQLNSFIGFYPGSYSSGNNHHDTGISNRQHKQLRTALIEAAWQAIRLDPALLETYQQLTKRMKGAEAIIRIARKLARRIYTMMRKKEEYQLGVVSCKPTACTYQNQ